MGGGVHEEESEAKEKSRRQRRKGWGGVGGLTVTEIWADIKAKGSGF